METCVIDRVCIPWLSSTRLIYFIISLKDQRSNLFNQSRRISVEWVEHFFGSFCSSRVSMSRVCCIKFRGPRDLCRYGLRWHRDLVSHCITYRKKGKKRLFFLNSMVLIQKRRTVVQNCMLILLGFWLFLYLFIM